MLICLVAVSSCSAAQTPKSITLTSSSPTIQANGVDAVTITAKILDTSGKPIPSAPIVFEAGNAISSIRSGYTWTLDKGSYGGIVGIVHAYTDSKGTFTIPYGWVDKQYGGSLTWVWVYSVGDPSVFAKKSLELTYPMKISIKASPPSIVTNWKDVTTIEIQVSDNKGKPFRNARVNMFVDETPWDSLQDGSINGESVQYLNGMTTHKNGKVLMTFGVVKNTSQGRSSTIKAYLADNPAISASTEVKFLPSNLPTLSAFSQKSAYVGDVFRFTLTGSRIRPDDRVILRKGAAEINTKGVYIFPSDRTSIWSDSFTKLYGQFAIPLGTAPGAWDVVLQRKNYLETGWEDVAILPGKFLIES